MSNLKCPDSLAKIESEIIKNGKSASDILIDAGYAMSMSFKTDKPLSIREAIDKVMKKAGLYRDVKDDIAQLVSYNFPQMDVERVAKARGEGKYLAVIKGESSNKRMWIQIEGEGQYRFGVGELAMGLLKVPTTKTLDQVVAEDKAKVDAATESQNTFEKKVADASNDMVVAVDKIMEGLSNDEKKKTVPEKLGDFVADKMKEALDKAEDKSKDAGGYSFKVIPKSDAKEDPTAPTEDFAEVPIANQTAEPAPMPQVGSNMAVTNSIESEVVPEKMPDVDPGVEDEMVVLSETGITETEEEFFE